MSGRSIVSLLTLLWIWSIEVHAGPIISNLRSHFANQANRPAMVDLLEVEPNLAKEEESGLVIDYAPRLKKLIQDRIPVFIANLEKAFPGGKYIFLGRDGAFLADIIDGYYLSKGEVGRVVRLDASRETFNTSPIDIYLFLQQKGLTPEKDGPPLVFLDRTQYKFINGNFNDSSQLMRILGSLYEVALTQGANSRDLLRRVAGISLQSNADYQIPLDRPDDYFKQISISEVNFGGNIKLRLPHTILRTDLRDFIDGNQNGIGGEIYLWSQGFGSLQLKPNGELVAPQKQSSSAFQGESYEEGYQRINRPWILAEMQLAYQTVSSKFFHHRVRTELTSVGVEVEENIFADPKPARIIEVLDGVGAGEPQALFKYLKWIDLSNSSDQEKLLRLENISLGEALEAAYLEVKTSYSKQGWVDSNFRLRRLFVLHHILQSVGEDSSKLTTETLNWIRRDFSKLVLAGGAFRDNASLSLSAIEAMTKMLESSGPAKESIALKHYGAELEMLGIPNSMMKKNWKLMTFKGMSQRFIDIYIASFKNVFGFLTGASTITVVPEILMHLSGPWPSQAVGMFGLHFLHLAIATGATYVVSKGVKFSKKGFSLPKIMPQEKLVQILESKVGSSKKLLCIQFLNQ